MIILLIEEREVHEFQTLVSRALNTWPEPPAWAMELADKLEAKMNKTKLPVDVAAIPSRFLEVK